MPNSHVNLYTLIKQGSVIEVTDEILVQRIRTLARLEGVALVVRRSAPSEGTFGTITITAAPPAAVPSGYTNEGVAAPSDGEGAAGLRSVTSVRTDGDRGVRVAVTTDPSERVPVAVAPRGQTLAVCAGFLVGALGAAAVILYGGMSPHETVVFGVVTVLVCTALGWAISTPMKERHGSYIE